MRLIAILLCAALIAPPARAIDRTRPSHIASETKVSDRLTRSSSLVLSESDDSSARESTELGIDDLSAFDSATQEKLAVVFERDQEVSSIIHSSLGMGFPTAAHSASPGATGQTSPDLNTLFDASAAARRRKRVRAVIQSALAEFTPRQLESMPQADLAGLVAVLQQQTSGAHAGLARAVSTQGQGRSVKVPSPFAHSHAHEHAYADAHAHSHDHGHDHGHHHHDIDVSNPALLRAARWALAIQSFATAVELIGGWTIGSVALEADSVHLAADLGLTAAPLLSAWMLGRFGERGWSRKRIGAAIALAGSAVIALTAVEAVARLLSPVTVPGGWAIGLAFVGLSSNWLASRLLRPHQDHDLSVKAAFQHFLVDVAGSMIIIVSGGLMLLTRWLWLDPIANFAIIGIVFYFNWGLVRDAWKTLFSAKEQEHTH